MRKPPVAEIIQRVLDELAIVARHVRRDELPHAVNRLRCIALLVTHRVVGQEFARRVARELRRVERQHAPVSQTRRRPAWMVNDSRTGYAPATRGC